MTCLSCSRLNYYFCLPLTGNVLKFPFWNNHAFFTQTSIMLNRFDSHSLHQEVTLNECIDINKARVPLMVQWWFVNENESEKKESTLFIVEVNWSEKAEASRPHNKQSSTTTLQMLCIFSPLFFILQNNSLKEERPDRGPLDLDGAGNGKESEKADFDLLFLHSFDIKVNRISSNAMQWVANTECNAFNGHALHYSHFTAQPGYS